MSQVIDEDVAVAAYSLFVEHYVARLIGSVKG